jgi:hypothetical protein
MDALVRLVRSVLWFSSFRRYSVYRYQYNFTPEQLAFFVQCLNETRDVPGDIVEIGCAAGHTTCYLNQHLRSAGINKDYICLDTFCGFVPDDVAFERSKRGKTTDDYTGFRVNSLSAFSYTLALNGCRRVFPVKGDVKTYKFSRPVSFCILDVDLYQPTISSLNNLWPHVLPGGIIVVDDCTPNRNFDGAHEAYLEFCKRNDLPETIILGTLGFVRK